MGVLRKQQTNMRLTISGGAAVYHYKSELATPVRGDI